MRRGTKMHCQVLAPPRCTGTVCGIHFLIFLGEDEADSPSHGLRCVLGCGLCPCPILNFIVEVADGEDKRALES